MKRREFIALVGGTATAAGAMLTTARGFMLTLQATNSVGSGTGTTTIICNVGTAPIFAPGSFTLTLPRGGGHFSTGQQVGQMTPSGGSPAISWAITAGNVAGYFAIDNSGNITITATGASNITIPGSYSLTCQATKASGSGSTTASITVQSGSGYTDGLATAPGSTGNPLYTTITTPTQGLQFSSLLNYYHNASSPAARYKISVDPTDGKRYQPPWNCPGIDYPVGINPSALPLKNAATAALPANCTRSGTTWTLTGNAVIDGYDFSVNGGMSINQGGHSLTLRNCYFKQEYNQIIAVNGTQGQGGPNFVAEYCVFDMNGLNYYQGIWTGGFLFLKPIGSNGNLHIRYCYFLNGSSEYIVAGSPNQTNLTIIVEYNVFAQSGLGFIPTGGRIHGDLIQTYGGGGTGTFGNITIQFNTIFCDYNQLRQMIGTQGFSINSANDVCVQTTGDYICQNNVMCSTPNVYGYGTLNNPSGSATACVGLSLVNRSWFNKTIQVLTNYIDLNACEYFMWNVDYYPERANGTGNSAKITSGNVNMLDASTLT